MGTAADHRGITFHRAIGVHAMSPPTWNTARTIAAVLLGALLFPLACFGALVLIVVVCSVTGAMNHSPDAARAGLGLTILAVYAIVLAGPVVGGVIGYVRARRRDRRAPAARPVEPKPPAEPPAPAPPPPLGPPATGT